MTPDDAVARDAIRALVADYACGVDHGRFGEVAALFVDDGTLELPDGRTARGREAIAGVFGAAAGSLRVATAGSPVRHHVTTHRIVRDDADAARGTAYFLVITATGLDHWGTYRDRYVRWGDTWYFASRTVRLDGRTARSI
jgi:uncharacterized protein (TIGR02246 family)